MWFEVTTTLIAFDASKYKHNTVSLENYFKSFYLAVFGFGSTNKSTYFGTYFHRQE